MKGFFLYLCLFALKMESKALILLFHLRGIHLCDRYFILKFAQGLHDNHKFLGTLLLDAVDKLLLSSAVPFIPTNTNLTNFLDCHDKQQHHSDQQKK